MGALLGQLAKLLAQAGIDALKKALKPKPKAVVGLSFKDVEHQRAQMKKATERVH